MLILAGAGSGKTRVICHRIANMLEKGVSPYSILTVTFTNKAAEEMVHRVEKLAGPAAENIWVSTFHSSAARMLRRDYDKLDRSRDFTILDDGDSSQVIKEILKDMGLDPKHDKPRSFLDQISRAKDELLNPDRWIDRSNLPREKTEKIHAVYSAYEKRLRRANCLDFGDLLVEAVRLLEVSEVQEKYQKRFQYVQVDEYQDTNHAQYRMVRLLSEGSRNLCVVGDDDQAIYEWRGADRRNILSFTKDFKDASVIKLYQNYRSTQPILNTASVLISKNNRLAEKRLFTERTGGETPEVWCCSNEYEEVDRVVAAIRQSVREGKNLRDHAIFYRVHAQSRVVEELLSGSGISYQILNGVSFYHRAEIKDVCAYLKAIANPLDDVAMRRIINNPARGIGDTSVGRVLDWARKFENADGTIGISFFDAFDRLEEIETIRPAARKKMQAFAAIMKELIEASKEEGIAEVLRLVIEKTRYCDQYDRHDPDQSSRVENVREFLSAAEEFQSSSLDPSLGAFLERIALATDVDRYDPDADAVILTTLHSAKGLEFRSVFIVGCEETIFPHSRVYSVDNPDAAMEEERRLAYVGFTRAMDRLVLLHAMERRIYGRIVYNPASRILRESGLKEEAPEEKVREPMVFEQRVGNPLLTRVVKAPNTSANRAPAPKGSGAQPGSFSEGDLVQHRKFGRGKIIYIAESGDDNEVVQIRFPAGVKNLLTRYANLQKT